MDKHPGAVAIQPRTSESSAAWVDGVWPQGPARPGVAPAPSSAAAAPAPPARPVGEEPRVHPDRVLVVLEEHGGCGNGRWCRKCREEIRDEALRWLRELNAPPERKQSPGAVPYRPWHAELLLGDA
jgi:hypothetical protein